MKKLDVLYAFDNNYAPFAGVSILSLLLHNESFDEIRVFTVLDNVDEENKEKLRKTINEHNRKLIEIDAKEINLILEKLGVPKYRGSYATHYRKFFHLFLPKDVEKLLYIDSDSIVMGDLTNLVNMDFDGKCVMVSLDTLAGKYKKLIGFGAEETYFNAGVTFIDVNVWKERQYADKLIDHITNVCSKYCNPDQDLFNLVVRGDTKVIGPEYNFQPAHRVYSDKVFFRNYSSVGYYTTQEIENARKNPMILHTYRYIGEFPWHKDNVHPDTPLFDQYLAISQWSDYEKKPANKGVIFKVEKQLYKILPKRIFLFIFSRALYYSFKKKNEKLVREMKTTERD